MTNYIPIKLNFTISNTCYSIIYLQINMSCQECPKSIGKHKFCSDCGTNLIVQTAKSETIDDIFAIAIPVTQVIYNGTDIANKKLELKYGQINDYKTLWQLVECNEYLAPYLYDTPCETCYNKQLFTESMQIYKGNISDIFNSSSYSYRSGNITSQLDPTYPLIDYAKSYHNNSLTQSTVILPILNLLNINHMCMHHYHVTQCFIREQFKHILIGLIENKINDPICGLRFVLELDQISDKISKLLHDKDIKDKTLQVKTTKYDKKIFKNPEFYEGTQGSYAYQIEQYRKKQKELDTLLNKIQCDLYYSRKNKEIYTKDKLMEIFKTESKIWKLDLENKCELFKIRHINIYILSEELENIFYFIEFRQKMYSIVDKFELNEGVTTKESIGNLLGFMHGKTSDTA